MARLERQGMELQQLLLLRRLRHYETVGVLRGEPAPSVRGILEAAGGGVGEGRAAISHSHRSLPVGILHECEHLQTRMG
jgi:hypothetical protein